MKRWGWGHEDVAFTHEDKPDLGPFLQRHLEIDVDRVSSPRVASAICASRSPSCRPGSAQLPDVVVRRGGEDAVAAVLRAAIDADAVVIPSAAARTSRAASNRRRPTPARSSRSTSAGWTECWPSTRRRGSRGCITFGLKPSGERDPLAEYDVVKSAIQQKFVDSGATLSHHLAVGTEHAAWLEQDIPAPGVAMLHGLFDGVDPGGNLNPGKVI